MGAAVTERAMHRLRRDQYDDGQADERAARLRIELDRTPLPAADDGAAIENYAELTLLAACCSVCCFHHAVSGTCRARPPVAIRAGSEIKRAWPTVAGSDWCGGWRTI